MSFASGGAFCSCPLLLHCACSCKEAGLHYFGEMYKSSVEMYNSGGTAGLTFVLSINKNDNLCNQPTVKT